MLTTQHSLTVSCTQLEHIQLSVHDNTNYNSRTNEFGSDIDPDNNLYNNIINNCEYYSDEQFKGVNMDGAFTIIHFNSRSLYKNYNNIKEYLCQFDQFSVIAVSETWLDVDACSEIELEGYELFTTNRTSKKGGGLYCT